MLSFLTELSGRVKKSQGAWKCSVIKILHQIVMLNKKAARLFASDLVVYALCIYSKLQNMMSLGVVTSSQCSLYLSINSKSLF